MNAPRTNSSGARPNCSRAAAGHRPSVSGVEPDAAPSGLGGWGLRDHQPTPDPEKGGGTLRKRAGGAEGAGHHAVEGAPQFGIPTGRFGPGADDADPVRQAQVPGHHGQKLVRRSLASRSTREASGDLLRGDQAGEAPARTQVEDPGPWGRWRPCGVVRPGGVGGRAVSDSRRARRRKPSACCAGGARPGPGPRSRRAGTLESAHQVGGGVASPVGVGHRRRGQPAGAMTM